MLHLLYAFRTCSSGRGLAIECAQQIGVSCERRMKRPAAKDTGGTGFMTASQTLQLHPKDNVLVALNDLRKGEEIDFSGRSTNFYVSQLRPFPQIDVKHYIGEHVSFIDLGSRLHLGLKEKNSW